MYNINSSNNGTNVITKYVITIVFILKLVIIHIVVNALSVINIININIDLLFILYIKKRKRFLHLFLIIFSDQRAFHHRNLLTRSCFLSICLT